MATSKLNKKSTLSRQGSQPTPAITTGHYVPGVDPTRTAVSPVSIFPAVVDEYLAHLSERGGVARLHRSVLRAGTTHGRELLAAVATDHSFTWSAVSAMAHRWLREEGSSIPGVRRLAKLPARPLLVLARVIALQNLLPSDRRMAYALYRLMIHLHGPRILIKPHGKLVADLAFRLGDLEFFDWSLQHFRLDAQELKALLADGLNPHVRPGYAEDRWVAAINALLEGDGTMPILLMPSADARSAFDRLSTLQAPDVVEGPKVTVAITTWRPDSGFPTAFRSISEQTWQNLEILVLDDHSPEEFIPFIQEVVATDARARLVRMPVNGGTYRARNRALGEATGIYFTVHDSDDWAHPQRIELQVARLEREVNLISCSSRALRADDRLVFNLPGVSPSRENASSLMFRRAEVMAAIGYYDSSRKGADTEFSVRMLAHFGATSHALLNEHLAFIRLSPGSLSREEFRPGWRHPSRLTYRLGYQWQHAARKDAGLPLRVECDGRGTDFPRPLRFLVDQDCEEAQRRRQWEVVFAFDARGVAARPAGVMDELIETAGRGVRVAILHMESLLYPLNAEVDPYDRELQQLICQGVVGEVLPTDDVEIGTLLVRDPSVLQFVHPQRLPLQVSRILAILEESGSGQAWKGAYDVLAVEDHAFTLFGREVAWLSLPEAERLAPATGPLQLVDHRWPTIRSRTRWRAPRPPLARSPLRVGRVVKRSAIADAWTYPNAAALYEGVAVQRAVFSVPDLTSNASTTSPLPSGGQNWVLDGRGEPTESYYALIDVYLLHGSDPACLDTRRYAMEAAASGCILAGAQDWVAELGHEALCFDAVDAPAIYHLLQTDPTFEAKCRSATAKWLEAANDLPTLLDQLCPGFVATQ